MFVKSVIAAVALVAIPQIAVAQEAVSMRTVRYYRADDHTTRVMAVINVPYASLETVQASSEASMVYAVEAQVFDSAGTSLHLQRWTQHIPATLKIPGATGLELMEFKVPAGRYRMNVAIQDSVTGIVRNASSTIDAYASLPQASDLLLSAAMRVADAADTVPMPGEVRRGSTLFVPAVNLRLTPLRSRVYYFLEAYTASTDETEAGMQVAVIGDGGKVILQTPATQVRLAPGGGILKGQLDLDGLPEGAYTLAVRLTSGEARFERTAPFEMAGLAETLAAAAQAAPPAQSDEAFFASRTEAQLDTLAEPLILIARSGELRNFDQLSVGAKRRFLIDFWSKLDQTPETVVNEERERFYGAVEYANREYRVGRGSQEPGWKSDRGRIYAKYGAADDNLRRLQSGLAPPYEVWRYTRGRQRYFVFADQTGFGAYKLVLTNDSREVGVPDWREILTEDAVRDIGLFLGVDFYGNSGRAF